ncbi:hypothetical protein NW759_013940 [Fusarium solani]|nr:hypothetical protein NW759_013940 [Fusarium solani]
MIETLPWPRKDAKTGAHVAEIIQDLTENSRSLFVPPYSSELDIEVAELSSRGTETFYINSEGGLREHLSIYHDSATQEVSGDDTNDSKDEEMKASILLVILALNCLWNSAYASSSLIEPAYGWGHLLITRDGMMSVLLSLDASPIICRYLKAFGRKDFPRDEGFAGFDSDITLDSSGTLVSFELCYMLKYVDRREDATPGTNPWSIRHALIHQKCDVESKRASNILVRLPERVKDSLGDLVKEDDGMKGLAGDWTWLHIACFSSVDHDLRLFINYLDEEITKVFDRVIMSGVEPTKLNEFDSVEQTSKDLKTLQYLLDQSRRLINVIELNVETIKCLQNEAHGLGAISSLESPHRPSVEVLSGLLEKAQKEHRFSLKNASAVLERAKATSEQASRIYKVPDTSQSRLTVTASRHGILEE